MSTEQTRTDEIRRRAYELWERNNYVHGCDLDHWLMAERTLTEEEVKAGGDGTADSHRSPSKPLRSRSARMRAAKS